MPIKSAQTNPTQVATDQINSILLNVDKILTQSKFNKDENYPLNSIIYNLGSASSQTLKEAIDTVFDSAEQLGHFYTYYQSTPKTNTTPTVLSYLATAIQKTTNLYMSLEEKNKEKVISLIPGKEANYIIDQIERFYKFTCKL